MINLDVQDHSLPWQRGFGAMKTDSRRSLGEILFALMVGVVSLQAQSPVNYQYFYDAAHQLTRAVDSTGASVQYSYDSTGNITGIVHSTISNGLSILSFSPSQGGPDATVTIQGQGFSATSANNAVKFNGVAATVSSSTATTLTATTGAISVTVGANTATSSTNFTVVAASLLISTTKDLLANQTGTTVNVTGINLSGATFAFTPAGSRLLLQLRTRPPRPHLQ